MRKGESEQERDGREAEECRGVFVLSSSTLKYWTSVAKGNRTQGPVSGLVCVCGLNTGGGEAGVCSSLYQ